MWFLSAIMPFGLLARNFEIGTIYFKKSNLILELSLITWVFIIGIIYYIVFAIPIYSALLYKFETNPYFYY